MTGSRPSGVSTRGRRLVRSLGGAALVLALLPAPALLPLATARAATFSGPIDGPITGGTRGRPFTSAVIDLAARGYVEEEFFLQGTATTWAPVEGSVLGSDGRWTLEAGGTAPFRTRLLVRRPAEASAFNGTVLVEWLNVTGGFDIDAVWAQVAEEVLRSGYAWVGVSAQRASVNGPAVLPGVSDPLVDWDPERYGSLVIADDASSYDLFTQAGEAVGRYRSRDPVDPLDGLAVRRLIAMGASQSAHRLASYVNGVHPIARVYDAFLIVARFGRGAPLAPGEGTPNPLRMRTDLATPVFTVNTESEALAHFAARQPDTGALRYWEIAGAAHQTSFVDAVIDAEIRRDLGFALPDCDPPANRMPSHHVLMAALDHLDRWAAGSGRPSGGASSLPGPGGPAPAGRRAIRRARLAGPPSFPAIAISGDPLEIERDAFGNARGGIRLPDLRVPTAQYGPVGMPEALRCDLRGFTLPFSSETLATLYPSHTVYVRRVTAAAFTARRAGFLLEPEARETIRTARDAAIP